ncbi:glycosyltransferase [Parasulfuritortus cantonensis]|uniref:Glycosyltransferase n=2 Tax=Parasulfuritortus cantonensis TaxID=2528202 RepID=A0A4R1BEK4_9PROT|nr:glycosyltransferase [Parasulfuritortus cantonensis]
MVTNLVVEFARRPGLAVDLVLLRDDSRHLRDLPANVNVVRLGVRHSGLSLAAIARYLRRARPDAMLVAKDRAGRAALLARKLAGVRVPIYIRLGTTLSEAMKDKSGLVRWLRYQPMRRLYPLADGVVAVSRGVADDTLAITGLAAERVRVIRNPVITPDIHAKAAEPLDHPWFRPGQPPVVLGMGRLTRQKDFPTLIRAFAKVHGERPARLVILGEGRDRTALAGLAESLGIAEAVAMPGFMANPYPWLARASLFVLSSAWEGSPNALTEALALGVPAVSTACPSGPDEILADGRYGVLVPVGDVDALAAAILRTLAQPLPAEVLRAAVAEYNSTTSADAYLAMMGLTTG